MAKKALVLQHIECEPAALIADRLLKAGIAVESILVADQEFTGLRDYCAIVCMGGPMSVYDRANLIGSMRRCDSSRDAVTHGLPYWGRMPLERSSWLWH